jgi:5-methylcytosine-specific restriction endonuclease McrA
MTETAPVRKCLRDPIPEIFEAADYLQAAWSAHLRGNVEMAEKLIRLADNPRISDWTESLWGAGGPWTRPLLVRDAPPFISKEQRVAARMPSSAEQAALLARDGYHCRFCGIPLIRSETRRRIRNLYPNALRWGLRNLEQHAGFQAMWLQYDHVLPHARGGTNDHVNLIVSCAPCNNGRSNLTLEEAGLADPRLREPIRSDWCGLEFNDLAACS